jgi:branched-chain amino acid aminotransferase
MNPQDQFRPDEFGWADPALRPRLRHDPAGVLREKGITIPPGLPTRVVHELVRVVSLVWQDGRIVTTEQFRLDPADEGLLFGRGVWESTRTVNGVPWLWPEHLDRLCRTAALLDIPVPDDRLPDARRVTEFVRTLTAMDVVLRLNLTAGPPGRPGTVWMTAALPPTPVRSVRLKTCRIPVEKGQPYLLWKTFQYATRLRVGKQAFRAGFDSALLLDAGDNLLEAAHANLFARLSDGWATPTADGGLLPGTVRRHLLDHAPVAIRERTIPRLRLADVREVFVTNSNVGIVPVTRIDDREFPVGDETRDLIRWLGLPSVFETAAA